MSDFDMNFNRDNGIKRIFLDYDTKRMEIYRYIFSRDLYACGLSPIYLRGIRAAWPRR